MNNAMNDARQKTISRARGIVTERTRIPPVLQQSPAAVINNNPLNRSVRSIITGCLASHLPA